MYQNKLREVLQVFGVVITFLFITSFANAQTLDDVILKKKAHPKIQSALEQLSGKGVIAGAGQRRPLDASTEEKIVVFIMAEPGKTADTIDKESLLSYGVEIIKSKGGVLKAKVPISQIHALADNVKGVSFIQLPDKPVSQSYQSEGVSLTSASSYPSQGYSGSGIKVAVIDLGFKGLSAAIANGDLPSSVKVFDCSGSSCVNKTSPWDLIETEGHGTAVAEIIRDMAPGVDLYLIKEDDELDLDDAKNFCIDNGIKIVNHSVGWFNTNFYDGKCWLDFNNPVCSVNDAFAHGILWVNSAGNQAQGHYSGTFTDLNNDTIHDESIWIYAYAGETIRLSLTWNAWPYTNQDYDLRLYNISNSLVQYSYNTQSGTQKPIEEISYLVTSTGYYYANIRNWSATSNHKLEFYIRNHDIIMPNVSQGSIPSPADADGALSVGAMNQSVWTTGPIESFSSQGPTTDGRIKPDITGPDAVANYTFPSGFSGTSAASPHVAGAAALILSRNPEYSVSSLANTLVRWAVDMGSAGKDNIFGYGRLSLPCFVDISTNNKIYSLQSASGSVSVSESTNSCPWYAKSLDPWITVTTGATGSGNGTVGYSVAENTGSERTGRILIGDRTFTIIQTNTTLYTQAQLDQAVTAANAAKDLIIAERDNSITSLNSTIASMFTQTQLDNAVADANAAKDLIIASMFTQAQKDNAVADANAAKDLIIAAMFTQAQKDKAVADANAAKDLIIASMFTQAQKDNAVADANAAKDLIIAAMFTQAQKDKAVADANAAKDLIIAAMFTQAQKDKAVADANAAKDLIIAAMFTQAQKDKAVADANAAKDLIIAAMFTQAQKDKAVADANAAKDLIIAAMFTQAQKDKAVADANAAKDLIIAAMFTQAQKDKAVADANAAKDLIIAAMFTQTQLDRAVADANVAKDLIIAAMFTQAQKDKAVADANTAKDLIIADMFTKPQLDQAVVEERIKWDINGDGKMGLEVVISILQKMVRLR